MIIIKTFQDHLVYLQDALLGIEIAVKVSGQVVKKITGDGILLNGASGQKDQHDEKTI
jgi:hypothetical protein